jgi:integrase
MVSAANKGSSATDAGTVGELLDLFLDQAASLGRSPTTLREYRRIADKVLRPELGALKLSQLTARDLDALYAKLSAKGNKPTTVRRVHALIGAALHQAEKWDLEAPDPAEVQRIITAAEAIEPGLAAMLLVAALTGARRGELCALRWSDVDWTGHTLSIARSVYETAGGGWAEKSTKTHQARRIGLDDLGLAVLQRQREQVDALADELGVTVAADGFIFSRSPSGLEPVRPDLLTRFTIRTAKAAGVSTHLHALRHFSATQGIAAGFDAVTVAGRLGHKDPGVTFRTYAHLLTQRDRDLAASLGRSLALPSA